MEKLLERLEHLEIKQQIATTYLLIWAADKEEGIEIPERHFSKIDDLYMKYIVEADEIRNEIKKAVSKKEYMEIVDNIWHVAMNKAARHKYFC